MPRPISVAIIAAFLFFATAIAMVVAIALLFPTLGLNWIWELNKTGAAFFHSIGRLAGVLLLALGSGTLAAGLALLRGRAWGWWFAVVLFAINSTGNLASYFLVHDGLRAAAGVVASSIFLYLLNRHDVRRFFFSQRACAEP